MMANLKLQLATLLVLLVASQYTLGVVGAGSTGTEFYVPFWVQAYNCSNGSCSPEEFFQESFQILYMSTNESTEVNLTVTYKITNGSQCSFMQHYVTIKPKETASFDVLETFATDLEGILEAQNGTVHNTLPWWIDQPVHIKVLSGGSVSIFVMSTISNATTVFPLHPVCLFGFSQWFVLAQAHSQSNQRALNYVPSEVLVIKPHFNETKMIIIPTVSAAVMCSLNFGYSPPCSTDLQPILDPQATSEYSTTLHSTDALVLVATDISDAAPLYKVPQDRSFAYTNLGTDPPAAVFQGRVANVTLSDRVLTTSIISQQVLDDSFHGLKFIVITNAASPFISSLPSLFNFKYNYFEWQEVSYVYNNHQQHPAIIQYYVWNSSMVVRSFALTSNDDFISSTNYQGLGSDTVAFMVTISTKGNVATGIYDLDVSHPERSAMLYVPSVEQYKNRYIIPDPRHQLLTQNNSSNHTYIITIIVPSQYFEKGEIMLDEKPIPKDKYLVFNMSEGPVFYAAKVEPECVNISHELYHTHPDGKFGVTVLGFTGYGESTRNIYSFPGNIQSEAVTTESHSPTTDKRTVVAGVTAGSLAAIIIVLVMASGCAYVVRRTWKNYRKQKQHYQPLLNRANSLLRRREPDGTNCQYDVFLSFADEDREFVEAYLYGPLEEGGFRVCWHHRDFPPGYSIIENIKNSIDHSRRVVLVLSEHFHRSEYCLFELRYSCEKMLATHTQFVIPVVLQQESLPRELDHLTYWKVNPEQPDPSDIEAFIQVLGSPIHVPQEVA